MVTIEQIKAFSDARGLIFEPLPADLLTAQQNIHIALTEPGCIRGNHYHSRGTETQVVAGPVLVRYRENGVVQEVVVPDGAVFRFVFPPNVTHAIKNTGTRPAAVVAFNTSGHDTATPDMVRDVILD